MFKFIKTFCILMSVAMLASAFAACGENANPQETTASTQAVAEDETHASTEVSTEIATEDVASDDMETDITEAPADDEITETLAEDTVADETDAMTEEEATSSTEKDTEAESESETQSALTYTVAGMACSSMFTSEDKDTAPLTTVYDQTGYRQWNHSATFDKNGAAQLLCETGIIAFDVAVDSVVFGYILNGAEVWDTDGTYVRDTLNDDERSFVEQVNATHAVAYKGMIAVNFCILLQSLHVGDDNQIQFVAKINGTDVVTLNEYTLIITETSVA